MLSLKRVNPGLTGDGVLKGATIFTKNGAIGTGVGALQRSMHACVPSVIQNQMCHCVMFANACERGRGSSRSAHCRPRCPGSGLVLRHKGIIHVRLSARFYFGLKFDMYHARKCVHGMYMSKASESHLTLGRG